MRLPGIVQVGGHDGGYGLLGFDGALFESVVVLVRRNSGIICLILEHLDFGRGTLLSPLSSFYLVRSVNIVRIKNLLALFIEEVLEVFLGLVQI